MTPITEHRPEYEINYRKINIDLSDEIRRKKQSEKSKMEKLKDKYMMEQEDIPDDWNLTNICSIHKKGRQTAMYKLQKP